MGLGKAAKLFAIMMPVKPFCPSNQGVADTKAAGGGCGQTSRRWQADIYCWLELPQVSFLSWQMFWQMWQTRVCHDKTCLISRQKYACGNKTSVVADTFLSQQSLSRQIFLVTNIILLWEMFVMTSLLLSWQACVYHNKTCLQLWRKCACHDKSFVATDTCLSRQKFCFCHDKHHFVVTSFIVASILLSWQMMCLSSQTHVCHNNKIIVTKIILVAAPTNALHRDNKVVYIVYSV